MNFIFKIIALFFLLINQSYSEIIKEFKISGNKRISDATIVLFSKLKINQNIENEDLNNVIKELYSTNYFKDVKITFKDQIVEITVDENPLVQTLVFNGIKKSNIISALKENIILKEKSPFRKSVVKKDETNIINFLNKCSLENCLIILYPHPYFVKTSALIFRNNFKYKFELMGNF